MTWSPDSLADGYQILYSKNSDFSEKHSTTKNTGTASSVGLTKLPNIGETWYVKMRAFVTVDGNRYGEYCTVVSIKVLGTVKTVSVGQSSYSYTGSEIKPSVTVKDSSGNTVSASNYSVTYSNNKNAGTAAVKVTGKGNYKGSASCTFRIVSSENSFT
ncbi:hypothetical protein SAMN02910317_01574 [Ruminococcaceae bacterium FB2012]|nr:hypothetical protein SAMN02910317_01574 [Ruminococcaceae bacterium FB2012]